MAITTNKRFNRNARDGAFFYNLIGEGVHNVEGLVQIANSDGEVVDPATGAAAATGGGSSTYSTAQGDFTATPTVGTTNITVTGLPFTLEAEHVVNGSIKRLTSAGIVSSVDSGNIAVSGGVITLSEADDFASGDSVIVSISGPDKAYDEALDSQIVTVLNPDASNWTSVEHLVDVSAQAADDLRYVIPMEGYKDISIHRKIVNTDASDTIVMTLWVTNNPDADDSADTDWVEKTSTYLSGTLTVNNASAEDWDQINNINPLKIMLKFVVTATAATNAIDVYIKKKAL